MKSNLLNVILILVSLLGKALAGWAFDLHRLATLNWDMVEHGDDIPPKKLLWLAIALGALEMVAIAIGIGIYAGPWPLYEWAMPVLVVAVLYAEALWVRYFTEPKHPYWF